MSMVKGASHGKETATVEGVWAKEAQPLPVPIREINTLESITLGFQQHMLEMTNDEGDGGSISSAAGYGGEAIELDWKDGDVHRQAVIRGSDLLIAWVETFDPEGAAKLREAQP